MRNLVVGLGVAGLLAVLAGCGDDGRAKNIGDTPRGGTGGTDDPGKGGASGSSGKGGSAGKAGSSDTGEGGEGGDAPVKVPPKVTITSPKTTASPADGVLSDGSVEIVCEVKRGGTSTPAIDAASVHIELLDAAGETIEDNEGAATGAPNEFSADFVLATVESGAVSFKCSAKDTTGTEGSDAIEAFVDHGPVITVVTPEPDSAHPVKGGLPIEFKVAATPLSKNDPGAEVEDVTFTMDTREFEIEEIAKGHFKGSLPLENTEIFPQVPTGAVTITAKNQRGASAVTATLSYNILIDGEGPVIAIQSPTPQKVVGGKVRLQFTVLDDSSGVSPESVNVTLYPGDTPRFFNPEQGWTRTNQNYEYIFDTKEVEPHNKVQTTINVRASDKVANQSASGQSVQVYLDNVPPQIDLDPRNIRTIVGTSCSGSFDPVGTRPRADLAGQFGAPAVPRIAWFRAFVVEQTNSTPGQTLFYHAGIDTSQVRLYVQPDPDNSVRKLLVNKNPLADNTCDDIGGIDDVENAPTFSALSGLRAAMGTPWSQDDPLATPAVGGSCTLSDGGNQPPGVCPAQDSDMWVVPYNYKLNEPAVFVVGTPGENSSCTGVDLEFLSKTQPEGWVCAAARVVDKAGNIGISPPLRLCVDDPETAFQPACRISSTTPPTCTDGCTPPSRGGDLIFYDP